MNKFKKGGFEKRGGGFGGRPKFVSKFGGARDGGNRQGEHRDLFPAVCADCGKKCEVPFRPSGERPVYCRDCFVRQPHVPGRNSNGADGPRQDFRRDVPATRVYQPQPVHPQSDGGLDALNRRFDSLESKVNRILETLSKTPAPAASVLETAPKIAKAKKTPARKAAKAKRQRST